MEFLPLILFWLAGLLTTCTVLHLWFTTTLPIELVLVLRAVGLLKRQVALSSAQPMSDMLRYEFDNWLILLETQKLISRRLAHILQCPGCFAVHAAFWIGVVILALTGATAGMGWRAHVVCELLGPATWPWLVCKMVAIKSKTNS